MRRRKFISLLGAVAALAPLAARAQQRERMRRIGVLVPFAADDSESLARISVLLQALQQLGWSVGRNLQIDYRWAIDAGRRREQARELVALAPDILVANGNGAVAALLEATLTIPVVFASVTDPIGNRFAQSMARPGGNATGFANFEFSIGAKWLELLKQIDPRVTRVAVLRVADTGHFGAIQAMAGILSVEARSVDAQSAGEIERGIAAFARLPNGGMIVGPAPQTIIHRDLIVSLAAQHRLPAVYPFRFFATSGGLVSYGPNVSDQFRLAAGYVDRILKGEKPADLPVQAPTKYETVLNMKTAKALGLQVPDVAFLRADEVIE